MNCMVCQAEIRKDLPAIMILPKEFILCLIEQYATCGPDCAHKAIEITQGRGN